MAGTITIGNLPLQASVLAGTHFPVESANVTYKLSVESIKSYVTTGVSDISSANIATTTFTATTGTINTLSVNTLTAGQVLSPIIGNVGTALRGVLQTAEQPNITQIGTITGGTWQATVVAPAFGGTGVNNGSNTITVSGTSFVNQDVRSTGSPTFNSVTASTAFNGNLSGTATLATLAANATKLATGRNINGVSFDGTANITISATAAASTLTGSTLATNVLNSSLTSVGTLVGLSIGGAILPTTNGTINIGSSGNRFATIFGLSTSAQYADLAENYKADAEYAPGTVVVFGGDAEVTVHSESHCYHVAGVVSTNPAYLMNSESIGIPVALTGRVPCNVMGPIRKGDRLVNGGAGYAGKMEVDKYSPGCGIGYSLEDHSTTEIKLIEIAVNKF